MLKGARLIITAVLASSPMQNIAMAAVLTICFASNYICIRLACNYISMGIHLECEVYEILMLGTLLLYSNLFSKSFYCSQIFCTQTAIMYYYYYLFIYLFILNFIYLFLLLLLLNT